VNNIFSSGSAMLTLLYSAMLASPAYAAPDLVAAKKLAVAHCGDCHSFEPNGPHGQGPNLYGLLGREAGTAQGFRYSPNFLTAMRSHTWDRKLLNEWLTDSQRVAPGNNMVYFQDDAQKRKMLADFLQSLHDTN
jgi:cytochrome c